MELYRKLKRWFKKVPQKINDRKSKKNKELGKCLNVLSFDRKEAIRRWLSPVSVYRNGEVIS